MISLKNHNLVRAHLSFTSNSMHNEKHYLLFAALQVICLCSVAYSSGSPQIVRLYVVVPGWDEWQTHSLQQKRLYTQELLICYCVCFGNIFVVGQSDGIRFGCCEREDLASSAMSTKWHTRLTFNQKWSSRKICQSLSLPLLIGIQCKFSRFKTLSGLWDH